MKHLKVQWKSRLLIVLAVSTIISILMISLEWTAWAQQINLAGYSHGEGEGGKRNIPAIMMYILPFVKELILIGVPLSLTLLIMKLFSLLKRVFKKVAHS